MLRFIAITLFDRNVLSIFQYIPCYGLSVSASCSGSASCSFQYIPCYGLSKEYAKSEKQINAFQYIPCYGLSPKVQQYIDRVESFQYIPCYGLSALGAGLREPPLYFNTSHVTVYQTEASKEFRSSHISIHPMLRFIESCLSR